jgi:acetylornithine deacetylase/succinyl-diaminopimelate desuccinylase-like protein
MLSDMRADLVSIREGLSSPDSEHLTHEQRSLSRLSEMTTPATRAQTIARAEAYVDDGRFEADLALRVAIRTESQKFPDKGALVECYRYLETEMTPAFAAMGFQSRTYDNPFEGQGPVLLAARIEDRKLPTVLGYGHGDVVLGMEERWTKGMGPWRTARDGERLYGRGTADNRDAAGA